MAGRDSVESVAQERAFDRIERLHRAIVTLSEVDTPGLVAEAILREAIDALGARGGLVFIADGPALRQLRAVGLPDAAPVPLDSDLPVALAVREDRALWFGSREELLARHPALRERSVAPDLGASVALPLVLKGRTIGAIGLYFGAPRTLDEEERAFAGLLARQCTLALDRVLLAEAERRAAERNALLARAGEVLSSSLDVSRVLEEFARLTVPGLADWCAVELVEGDHTRQVTVAHVDPAKVKWAWEIRERYPPDPDQTTGVQAVIRTGRAELYKDIPDAMLVAATRDPEHLRITRELGMKSAVCVPLIARERVIGAITMVWAESGHRYTEPDLELLKDLGRRAGLAIDNARLYADLAASLQLRDEFLSVAGHELNTPLAALLLQLQSLQRLARSEAISPRLADRIGKAVRAVTRLDALVRELLDVSRIASGRLQLDPEDLDLAELVDEVTSRLSEVAAVAGCPMTLRVDSVRGVFDRARIDQVVTNLLSNAIKYGAGKPVEVELKKHDDEAVLRIVDHGIGIAPEQQARIFDRFERAVGARDFSGLGLGLWITRQIVEASGGGITVRSEPGRGSEFTVRLPLTRKGSTT